MEQNKAIREMFYKVWYSYVIYHVLLTAMLYYGTYGGVYMIVDSLILLVLVSVAILIVYKLKKK